MDLFHAITQGIEDVLSCHWSQEFRSWKPSTSSSNSSSTSSTPSTGRSLSRSNSSVSATLSRSSSSRMSGGKNQLMDTEAGGEQTQYESIKTVTEPSATESGQLGNISADSSESQDGVSAERAQKTTENIRYGQNISESGMGGMTNTTSSEANQEGGYGGTQAQNELEKTESNPRTAQQYSAGDGVHDYKVGG